MSDKDIADLAAYLAAGADIYGPVFTVESVKELLELHVFNSVSGPHAGLQMPDMGPLEDLTLKLVYNHRIYRRIVRYRRDIELNINLLKALSEMANILPEIINRNYGLFAEATLEILQLYDDLKDNNLKIDINLLTKYSEDEGIILLRVPYFYSENLKRRKNI